MTLFKLILVVLMVSVFAQDITDKNKKSSNKVGQVDGIGNATSDSSSYEDISDEYVNPTEDKNSTTALKCYSCTSYEDILNIQFLDEFPRCSTEEGANNGFYGDLKSCATPDTTCFKGIYTDEVLGNIIMRGCATANTKPSVGKCVNIVEANMRTCYCDNNGCNGAYQAHSIQYPILTLVLGLLMMIIATF